MQCTLSEQARLLARADEAEAILRSCVHCGFCNATCPTYQLLGDERDGPRGRIYLIKNFLEGSGDGRLSQVHLDRCLSCRSCETSCPSGVDYHTLLDIGRDAMAARRHRPLRERLLRRGLRMILPRPGLFAVLLRLGRLFRPLLPAALKEKIPLHIPVAGTEPAVQYERRMLLPEGCVQPALSPRTNAATARVLSRLGISVLKTVPACCGAMDYHLDAQQQGLQRARRNIDMWWPAIEAGAEAIVHTASGCGAFIKEYGKLLADDAGYAQKAARVSELSRDLLEVIEGEEAGKLLQSGQHSRQRIALHCPCTLQHGQQLGGRLEALLGSLGFMLAEVRDAHLCCGSAGTYAITQRTLAQRLRDNKLAALESGAPDRIVTANIGCQLHLDMAGRTPVGHWIELLDQSLQGAAPGSGGSRAYSQGMDQ